KASSTDTTPSQGAMPKMAYCAATASPPIATVPATNTGRLSTGGAGVAAASGTLAMRASAFTTGRPRPPRRQAIAWANDTSEATVIRVTPGHSSHSTSDANQASSGAPG